MIKYAIIYFMSYSIDFRKKVLSIRKKKHLTLEQTAKRFDVGIATVYRWTNRIEACKKRNKPTTKIDMENLKKDLELCPDAYNYERAEKFKVSTSCIFFAIKRLGVSYKKNSSSPKSK